MKNNKVKLIKNEYVKFIDGVFEASESDPVITTIKDHELNLGNFEVRYHKDADIGYTNPRSRGV
jgi:hypothetical protein